MENNNNFETEEKKAEENLDSEINNESSASNHIESITENTSEEELNALGLNQDGKKGLKAFILHYLPVNIIDGVIAAIITAILSLIVSFILNLMGYAIASAYANETNLVLFIIIFILYKSYGPASKKGSTFGERIIK